MSIPIDKKLIWWIMKEDGYSKGIFITRIGDDLFKVHTYFDYEPAPTFFYDEAIESL